MKTELGRLGMWSYLIHVTVQRYLYSRGVATFQWMMAEVDEKTLESSTKKEKNDTLNETVPVLQK